jgi:hypothetical protein
MMKNYMTMGAFTKGKKPEGDLTGKVAAPFPKEKMVMSIYGGPPPPHVSRCKLKLTSRAVNAISPATLEYLRWSESPITFDRTDHSNSIPKPGRFCLIVDPLVRTTCVRVIYPRYRGPLVMDQNSRYDRFPPVENGWGTIHPYQGMAAPLQVEEEG